MFYHRIAVNVPLSDGLLTYSHSEPLPPGTRVLVPFRNKTVVGIVWETDIAPDMDAARILGVQTTFFRRAAAARKAGVILLSFTSRYYHYPTGQAVFAALPQGLKGNARGGNAAAAVVLRAERSGQGANAAAGSVQQKSGFVGCAAVGRDDDGGVEAGERAGGEINRRLGGTGLDETAEAAKPVLRSSEFQLNANQQQASDENSDDLRQLSTSPT